MNNEVLAWVVASSHVYFEARQEVLFRLLYL